MQAQNVGQSSNPKAFRRSLFLLTVAAVIKLRLGQLLNRHEAGEAVRDVAIRLLLLNILGVFVIFFGNVQREVEEWIMLLALLSAH